MSATESDPIASTIDSAMVVFPDPEPPPRPMMRGPAVGQWEAGRGGIRPDGRPLPVARRPPQPPGEASPAERRPTGYEPPGGDEKESGPPRWRRAIGGEGDGRSDGPVPIPDPPSQEGGDGFP